MKVTMLLAVLAATAGCSTGVLPMREQDKPPVQVVDYEDLDITGSAGALMLYERIEQAALRACEPMRLQVLLHDSAPGCVRRAVADAVSDINAPALTSIHSRYGRLVGTRRALRSGTADPAGGSDGARPNGRSCHEGAGAIGVVHCCADWVGRHCGVQ
jgi:UrcA family protein